MRVRNRVVCVALALCAAWPAAAAADVDSIVVAPGGAFPDFLCLGATSASPIQLALTTPQGTTLQTITLPAADNAADTGCPAFSTATFEPGASLPGGAAQPAFGRYPAGTLVTATQDGVSVAFALPYAAYSDGVTLIHALPNPAALTGGVVDPTAPGSYNGPAASQGDTVIADGSVTSSNGTPVAIHESVTPAQYRVQLDGQTVTVTGGDPLANDVGGTLSAPGGGVLGRVALRTRLGGDCAAGCQSTATFDSTPIGGGSVSVAGQSGWFAGRSVGLPAAVIRLDGFDVAVPAGDTGVYSYDLRFIDLETVSARAPFDPFRCTDLGPAVTCGTGTPVSRGAVSASGAFVAPGDTIAVNATDPDGDSANISATAQGFSGSLDDGSVIVIGNPKSPFTAALSSPRTPPLPPYTGSDNEQTDSSGTYTLSGAFETHINNGATVTFSGAATGPVARTFQWNLGVGLDASNVLHGTTYPGAHVAVDLSQGTRTTHLETVARGDGIFAIPLGDARAGDTLNVAAGEPATHELTTTVLGVGGPTLKITGVTDGQFLRGSVTPTIAGAGLDSVFWNADSSFPSLLALSAPFPYPLDSTRFGDGTYRIEAAARPAPGASDYLYVTVDNTPPSGSAGADQTVAKGRTINIVTGASDDTSGLASVKVDYGDNKRRTISGSDFEDPLTHAYTKLGTFTVAVTITDNAGNVTSDTARIRVVATVAPSVGGKFAGRVVRKHKLAAKLTAHQPGQLEIFIMSNTGVRKLTKRVTFGSTNQKITVTLLTAGLKLGRFTLVEQFTDKNGISGPVQAHALQVVKAPPPKKVKKKVAKKTAKSKTKKAKK